jgi:hypothetical protein
VSKRPQIELLWWRGCPSWEQAIELVRAEMQRAGLDPGTLRVREIRNESEAEQLGFPGSPTVLVDGNDIDPPTDQPGGLTCRVYRLRDGRASPLPDRAAVREALTEARGG